MQISVKYTVAVEFFFFLSYWCILVQIIRASFVEWLQSFDSAVLRSRLPSHTLQRCEPTTDSAWDVPSAFQCFATVGSSSLSFEMQCHFQKRTKRFSLTFCRISFKFFWYFSSILNFLFLIESYLKSNVLLPSHKDCQFLRVRFFRNWCNLSRILFVSWAVVDFCFFLG